MSYDLLVQMAYCFACIVATVFSGLKENFQGCLHAQGENDPSFLFMPPIFHDRLGKVDHTTVCLKEVSEGVAISE